MAAFAVAATEETLLGKLNTIAQLEKDAAETEVKVLTADDTCVNKVYLKLLTKQKG
jgi:hypothetical protein